MGVDYTVHRRSSCVQQLKSHFVRSDCSNTFEARAQITCNFASLRVMRTCMHVNFDASPADAPAALASQLSGLLFDSSWIIAATPSVDS